MSRIFNSDRSKFYQNQRSISYGDLDIGPKDYKYLNIERLTNNNKNTQIQ